MKVLVTGGAGFVGTTLLPLLLERKYNVTVLDRLMYDGNLLVPFFRFKNFEFVKGDIRDRALVKKICKDKDVIIHLAAIVGFPACRHDPQLAVTTNVSGTSNIARAVSLSQRIIFASTGSNYGRMEKGWAAISEGDPLQPLSIYGKTKVRAEGILMDMTSCTSLRFATGFGLSPRLRLDLLINDLVFSAIRQRYIVVYEADHKRSFIHVHDMARAIIFILDHLKETTGEIYNVGSASLNYSKREVCEMIKKQTGAYLHFADVGKDEDQRNYTVSYQKICSLGYRTTVNIDQGITELIKACSVVEIHNPYSNL